MNVFLPNKILQDNKYNIFIAEIESNYIFIFLKKYLNTIFHTRGCYQLEVSNNTICSYL